MPSTAPESCGAQLALLVTGPGSALLHVPRFLLVVVCRTRPLRLLFKTGASTVVASTSAPTSTASASMGMTVPRATTTAPTRSSVKTNAGEPSGNYFSSTSKNCVGASPSPRGVSP